MTALILDRYADAARSVRYLHRLLAANDITQALQIGVDQVIDVFGCDVSWAGLIEDGYLVMSAHHGLVSSEMASAWRLKVGEGIGGRVVAERRPQMSRDYRHDSRRVPLMKRLIDNEGIQATLTVPLLSADTSLGVLYAAHRRPYPWTEEEQCALEEIADDLAVRLHQLDVEGRRSALVRTAERRYERALRSEQSCARLAVSLTTQDNPGTALDLVALEIGGRVELRQCDGQLICASGEVGEGNPRTVWRTELAGTQGLTVSVIHTQEPDELDFAVIELVVGLFRLQFLRLGERERTVERLSGELFDQLLTGRITDPETIRQRMSLMGLSVTEGAQVVVAGCRRQGSGAPALSRLAEVLTSSFSGCLTTERHGRLVALLHPAGHPADLRSRLTTVLGQGRNRDFVLGTGRPCHGLIDYSISYDEARAACELGLRGSAEAGLVSAHDLGILGMASLPTAYLRTTVRDVLGPLVDADGQRGTDFVETLRTYLSHDRHLPAAAAALHVHYNTVRNRIARIESLLGVDMRNVDDRFRLETALRMHALTQALGDSRPEP